jgi:hypothetical protein
VERAKCARSGRFTYNGKENAPCCRTCERTNGARHGRACDRREARIQAAKEKEKKGYEKRPSFFTNHDDTDLLVRASSTMSITTGYHVVSTEWSESVAEAEDDAYALCLGFLIVQFCCKHFMELDLPVEHEELHVTDRQRNQVLKLWGSAFSVFVIVVVARSWYAKKLKPKGRYKRFARSLQNVCGMIWAWIVFKHGDWFVRDMCIDMLDIRNWSAQQQEDVKPAIHMMSRIGNAFGLTIGSTILLLILDRIADLLKSRGSGVINCCSPEKKNTIQRLLKEVDDIVEDGEDEPESAKVLREVIAVLGFLVGICWEKSFSQANVNFSHSFYEFAHHTSTQHAIRTHKIVAPILLWFADHPIIGPTLMGIITVGIVMLAWWKYLAPYARASQNTQILLLASQLVLTKHALSEEQELDWAKFLGRQVKNGTNISLEGEDSRTSGS